MRRVNLFLFTYDVPSYVMASVSHICLALPKLWTLGYSSLKRTQNKAFQALELSKNLYFLLFHPLTHRDLVQLNIIWNVISILYNIPQIDMYGLKVCNHPFLLVVIFDSFEQWWLVGSISFFHFFLWLDLFLCIVEYSTWEAELRYQPK